jgi:hypothetical protein
MKPGPAAPVTESPEERIQAALLHFEITMRTYASGVPVDALDAMVRMARALTPEGEGLDQLGAPITFLPDRRVREGAS